MSSFFYSQKQEENINQHKQTNKQQKKKKQKNQIEKQASELIQTTDPQN